MKILVTGGAGFIGYHLVKRLIEDGHDVTSVDNYSKVQSEEAMKMYYDLECEKIYMDLTGLGEVNVHFNNREFDIIYHLGAINGTFNFYDKPMAVISNNITATMNVMRYIKTNKIVFSSSCEAYAGGIKDDSMIPTPETIHLSVNDISNPRWSYGATKMLEEIFITHYCIANGIKYNILRYHNVYGIRDSELHVIPKKIKEFQDNDTDIVTLYGNDTRAFIHVDDCVEYTIRLGKDSNDGIFNVGTQEEVYIKEVASKIKQITNSNKKIVVKEAPEGSVSRRCPSMKKTILATGYEAKFNLDEGLKDVIENSIKL